MNNTKLLSSLSEQSVYYSFVYLDSLKPNDSSAVDLSNSKASCRVISAEYEELDKEDPPIQVERSKALHELFDSHKSYENRKDAKGLGNKSENNEIATSSGVEAPSENEECQFLSYDNPHILSLTRNKWLTEGPDGSPDASPSSSSPSLSSSTSSSSQDCKRSDTDRRLSTILKLDKEHNMFGMSDVATLGSEMVKKVRKKDQNPVFPQTAIVQICCASRCCGHKSNTDLPSSLRCGGCRTCLGCFDPYCSTCGPCGSACNGPPFPSKCTSCPSGKCPGPCPPVKYMRDCGNCFGMNLTLHRKEIFKPTPMELTPRSSCVLQLPSIARTCHHTPTCIPPSSCFPYLMPCYWPSRPSAPCSVPTRCFHNPPCLPARKRKQPNAETCPPKCHDDKEKKKCSNKTCPGNIKGLKEGIESKYGKS